MPQTSRTESLFVNDLAVSPTRTLCPIRKLPPELLSNIFNFGITCDFECREIERDHLFPLFISHVCRQWRYVALSTPYLWTAVIIPPTAHPVYYEYVSFQLERSKNFPIDVLIDWGERVISSDSDNMLFTSLVEHIHRWRSITAEIPSCAQTSAFLGAISSSSKTIASQLTSVSLTCRDDLMFFSTDAADYDPMDFPAPFGRLEAPNVQTIALSGIFIDWSQAWISSAANLTTLDLVLYGGHPLPSLSWTEFTTVLRGAPNLEFLVLTSCGSLYYSILDFEAELENAPIPLLPKLEELVLSSMVTEVMVEILSRLYMPGLKSLEIRPFEEPLGEIVQHLVDTPTSYFPIQEQAYNLASGLESLQLERFECSCEDAEMLCRKLNNLVSLKVYQSPVFIHVLMALEIHRSDHDWLPRLKAICLVDTTKYLNSRIIRSYAQHRKSSNVPVKSLFWIEREDSEIDITDEDLQWLKENIRHFSHGRNVF